MQFTKAEEYGIFGVLYLAQTNDNRVVPLSEISQAQSIPEKFLAKIFQSLSKSGLVRSYRGVRGGFALAKPAAEITMKDILETIQGPYHLMPCTEDQARCDKGTEGLCAVRELLVIAENRLVSTFASHTLADMVEWQRTGTKPQQIVVHA